MKSKAVGRVAAIALGLVLAGCASTGGRPTPELLQAEFAGDIQPVLQMNCTGCHGATQPRAGVSLVFANFGAAQAQDGTFWSRVRIALTSGRMPPAQAPRRPTDEERDRLVEFIEEYLQN
jgi:mono/diheme cytochrome c family protein